MRLDKKYRPAALAEVIAQDKAVKLINRFIEPEYKGLPGICGRAFYITGKSGTGKSTIAEIMAAMVADPIYIDRVNGRDLTVNFIKELIYHKWAVYPMAQKQGCALIVNESHGLQKPVIEFLLDVLENIPANVLIIFTTTIDGDDLFQGQADSGPFASRCVDISLDQRNLAKPFAAELKRIAELENLDGQPIEAYVKLCKENRNNFRACLMEIDSGKMLN